VRIAELKDKPLAGLPIYGDSDLVLPGNYGSGVCSVTTDARTTPVRAQPATFIIRLLVLPAVMHLVGPAMWWMPAWLERRLPHLNIERPDTDDEPPSADGAYGEPQPQPASG
jgi:RND superfamily putative drug exporter